MSLPECAGAHAPLEPEECIRLVLILGAGRWARVIAGELLRLDSCVPEILMHSRNHEGSLRAWASGVSARIRVIGGWPPSVAGEPATAVVVANAAADHACSARWVMGMGIPLLVEKPLTVSKAEAESVVTEASAAGIRLACSNVFLFHPGIIEWVSRIRFGAPLVSIHVEWEDPAEDVRHGALKRHDPGLTVIQDWIPHILPLLFQLAGTEDVSLRSVRWGKGRDAVDVACTVGSVSCHIRLDRKGAARVRRIGVVNACGGRCFLDYSNDPAVASEGGEWSPVGGMEKSAGGPLLSMLRAFLAFAGGGGMDPRLDPALAIQACAFAEACAP